MAGACLHDFADFLYFSVFTKETLSAMCKISFSLRAAISVNRILLSVSIQVKVLLVFSQSFAKITIDISDVGEDINQTPLNISEHLLIKKKIKNVVCCSNCMERPFSTEWKDAILFEVSTHTQLAR